jgi:hypothetical protein
MARSAWPSGRVAMTWASQTLSKRVRGCEVIGGRPMTSQPRTLFDKVWDAHVMATRPDGQALLATWASQTLSKRVRGCEVIGRPPPCSWGIGSSNSAPFPERKEIRDPAKEVPRSGSAYCTVADKRTLRDFSCWIRPFPGRLKRQRKEIRDPARKVAKRPLVCNGAVDAR